MPRVPTYDSFQVAPAAQPSATVRAPAVPDTAGPQIQQIAQATDRAGDAMARMAIDMQNEANQLRVDDAINRAKEAVNTLTFDKDAGFTNIKGIDALERKSGKPLADEYHETLKERLTSIADGLGNDAQKQAFSMRANDMLTSFRGQAMQHEAAQFKEYALSVREGTIANRTNEIGLNYSNPKVIDEAITSIQASVFDQARLLGKSAEWAEAQARKLTSNAHKVALGAALEKNDVAYADAYLKKYAGQMDADDLLRVQGLITKEMDTRAALNVATEVMARVAPRIATSDADRAFNIALGTESGNRQFGADGKPLTSPAGAVGAAQVMPGTGPEAAKLAGLKWDENRYRNDADYNRALGRAYFGKQLQDFGGDLGKAYAAYNAGPGWVREAIKRAEKAAPGTQEADWFWQLNNDGRTPENRKQTQDYVTKNLGAYATGEGAFPRPTLQEVHAAVRKAVGDNPARLKIALDESTRQYEEVGKAIKQREDDAVANAMRALQQNGGRWGALPISVRAAVPPKEVDNLMSFGQRVAKGSDITNPALYQRLATDTQYLKGLSELEFYRLRSELSESDFKHFAKERADAIAGKSSNTAGDLNTAAINQVLGDRLRTLSMDPSPKDGSPEAMQVGAMRKFVRDSILAAQQAAGKKFTDAEVEKHIDGLFVKSQQFRTTFLGISTGTTSERLLTMKPSDIPAAVRDKLRADFKAAGVDPTDGDLLGAYWKLKFAAR